jgi:hypothetical protein
MCVSVYALRYNTPEPQNEDLESWRANKQRPIRLRSPVLPSSVVW